ncbi:glycoside hydrolase family 61 protein [Ceratobasidium sp. AG-Ba]|nr:glycoside hydrolase family 61 protein [Ceratobasidium sp. AG-Ba]
MFSLPLTLLAAATSVLAHGYVQEIKFGSPAATFSGYLPNSDPYYSPPIPRIVRKIPGNGPVTDLSLTDVQCNGYTDGDAPGSTPASLVATVAAGSSVSFNWTTWPDSHVGPLITYMAKAPSDITKWSPGTSAVWFKVAEQGLVNGKWAASELLLANKGIYTFTIPASLKAGQYLIRHEIIALHAAYTYPGAQVYPMCAQVSVTGSGSGLPTTGLVAFPGAYTASTPGIVYDAYRGNTTYPIPGVSCAFVHLGSPDFLLNSSRRFGKDDGSRMLQYGG